MQIVQKTTTQPYQADLSALTQEQKDNVQYILYRSETDDYEVEFNDKYERNLMKEEAKRLKAENKMLKERISDATDFNDLKTKVSKVSNSESNPTKWSDKVEYLEGEHIIHKEVEYISLKDHTASKDAEPQNTPELYKKV